MERTIFKTYGFLTSEEENDWKENIQANQRDMDEEELSELDLQDRLYEEIQWDYEDEQLNLSKKLPNNIVALADLGLWYGRRSGYKIYSNNLNEILRCGGCDEFRVYVDQYNVKAEGYHHDGYNHVEYRELREDTNYQVLLDKLYSGIPVTRAEIRRYTKSLRPYIKDIYGI